MKSTGVLKRINKDGRIMIPQEIRQALDIQEWDPLEIIIHEEGILLKKK